MNNSEQLARITERVIELTPHSKISLPLHIFPTAQQCKFYAQKFKADPFVTEAAGLLHDIGYAEGYNSKRQDHIDNGVRIAARILTEQDIPWEKASRIIDCIRTHDGNLKPNSQIENIIVNDADALTFLRYPEAAWYLFTEKFEMSSEKAAKSIREHAQMSYGIIRIPEIKKLAEPAFLGIRQAVQNLQNGN